jgi:hypothetical protein
LLSLAAMACDNSDSREAGATVTGSPGNSATAVPATAAPQPTSVATRVDEIIAAAVANDTEALLQYVVFTPTACATNVQGAGGAPDCRPGEVDGALVPVLAIADCEGHFVREDEIRLEPLEAGAITFLNGYAAPEGFFPDGEEVLLFRREQPGIGEIGLQLIVTDDAVTGIRYGCGITAEEMIELHGLGEAIY